MRKMTLALLFSLLLPSAAMADDPHSVIATFRPKPGSEAQLDAVLTKHWETLTRLGLVTHKERYAFRARDAEGKPYVIEFLTWKDASIPDNIPAEVMALWKQMHEFGTVKIEEVERIK